jgi:hypothetical protein
MGWDLGVNRESGSRNGPATSVLVIVVFGVVAWLHNAIYRWRGSPETLKFGVFTEAGIGRKKE